MPPPGREQDVAITALKLNDLVLVTLGLVLLLKFTALVALIEQQNGRQPGKPRTGPGELRLGRFRCCVRSCGADLGPVERAQFNFKRFIDTIDCSFG